MGIKSIKWHRHPGSARAAWHIQGLTMLSPWFGGICSVVFRLRYCSRMTPLASRIPVACTLAFCSDRHFTIKCVVSRNLTATSPGACAEPVMGPVSQLISQSVIVFVISHSQAHRRKALYRQTYKEDLPSNLTTLPARECGGGVASILKKASYFYRLVSCPEVCGGKEGRGRVEERRLDFFENRDVPEVTRMGTVTLCDPLSLMSSPSSQFCSQARSGAAGRGRVSFRSPGRPNYSHPLTEPADILSYGACA